VNLRQLNRIAPLPSAVVTDHLPPFARKPTPSQLVAAWNESAAVLEQRLSMALADLYQRNVQCLAGLEPNQRQERHEAEGRMLTGNGAPNAEYMRTGKYLLMRVSVAMARRLLERDGGLTGVS
jgi:hypothetical protein